MRRLVTLLLALVLLLITPKTKAQTWQQLPNIIIFLVDDAGFGSFSPYNNQIAYTPNIQALTDNSTLYTRFYHSVAVCIPTRYGLLTGFQPTNQPEFFNSLDETREISASIVTLPEQLQTNGYRTGISGKWQLGGSPEQQGFEWTNITQNLPETNLLDRQYNTHQQTISAIDFIRSTTINQPMFLYMAYTAPHTPHYPFWEGITGKGLFADSIYEIDWSIGEIIRQMELRNQLDNTMIIFMSDNGPRQTPWIDTVTGNPLVPPGNPYAAYDPVYDNGWRFEGGNSDNHFGWNFRQPTYKSTGQIDIKTGKQTIFEPGVRVPAIVKWPTGIGYVGQDSNLRWTGDIYATIDGLLGQMHQGQGHNLLEDGWQQIELYKTNGELGAIVTDRWKYHTSGELYDLWESTEEINDVSGSYPNIVKRFISNTVYLPVIKR